MLSDDYGDVYDSPKSSTYDDSKAEKISSVLELSNKYISDNASSMEECKSKIQSLAQKNNVTYILDTDNKEYVSGKIVKNGTKTELSVMCKKEKEGYYQLKFDISK